jgi:[ribosomal protein S5]-alanine N-acetyltransferase
MGKLFEAFPLLESEMLVIRKMTEDDVDALSEITNNDLVYRYIPPFLYKKSRGNLLAAIRNLGGRDFDKKKLIIAGIYLRAEPDKLIGLAEVFDYKKRISQVTIGYRINENYWHRGIATETVRILIEYLCGSIGIQTLKAFVMPENVHSEKALLKNGFVCESDMIQGQNWGGQESVALNVFTYNKADDDS